MSAHEDTVYLQHILDCVARVEHYMAIGTFKDEHIYDAVIRRLQIMAESTQKLSDAKKVEMPEISWSALAAFRNILVHNYLGDIDPVRVEKHIREDMPLLKSAILRIYQPKDRA